MTTTIVVKANHGWPVTVTPLTADGAGYASTAQRVEPNEEKFFAIHSGQDLLIHEVQPEGAAKPASEEHIMQFFAYAHLPAELQQVSRPFGQMAERVVALLPRNPERTVALRKILEAKDAAVRAFLAKAA